MSIPVKVPVARLSHDQILVYEEWIVSFHRTAKQKEAEKNLTRGAYNGFMSPKTKSKVRLYISTWLKACKNIQDPSLIRSLDKVPFFTFVTLTLSASQVHTDNEIKRKMLMPFIEEIKKRYFIRNYFWRAEAQKNGNIHFHLIVDSYIYHESLRDCWNNHQSHLGYILRFKEKHGHDRPNSTDIHILKNVQSVESYVIKYCTKVTGERPIKGRIHGCSDEIRKLKPYADVLQGELEEFVELVIKDADSKVMIKEDFTIIKCSVKKMLQKYSPKLQRELALHDRYILEKLYGKGQKDLVIKVEAKKERKKLIQAEIFDNWGR